MKKTLRILQTSDLHGYIYPRSYATMKEEKIGIAQLSSLVNEYRNDNTILIDSGDTIQGSPFTYYLNKNHKGKSPIADIMNYMNYDYVTIGNHEFNYGRNYLQQYLSHLDATILNSNILKNNKPLYGEPYEIKTINGIRIAFIGVTTHYIPNWEQASTIEDLEFTDAFTTLKRTVEDVRNYVDLVIVSYHGGFERDFETGLLTIEDTGENQGYKMIKEISGIDLLLTGHQHRYLAGSLFGTTYVQPGYNGSNLSKVDIIFDTDTKEYTMDVELLEPTSIIDEKLLSIVNNIEEKTNQYLDTPVGHTKMELIITNQIEARIHKHPLITMINHVQKEFTGSDLSLCGLGNNVSGFNKDISIRDVISTYIYPNTLVVKEISGETLLKGLEKTAEFFEVKDGSIVVSEKFKYPKVQLYAYDMYDGISYDINLKNQKGHRIENLQYQGKTLNMKQLFTIAMNNYRGSGGGDYLFYKAAKTVNDTQTEILEILIDYILKEKELKIEHKNNINFIY